VKLGNKTRRDVAVRALVDGGADSCSLLARSTQEEHRCIGGAGEGEARREAVGTLLVVR
jgi:hypothetical protein